MYLFPDGSKWSHAGAKHQVADLVTLAGKTYKITNVVCALGLTTYHLQEMAPIIPVGTIVFSARTKRCRVMKDSWKAGQVVSPAKAEDLTEEKMCEPGITKRYDLNKNEDRIQAIKALRLIEVPYLSMWGLKELKEWVESIWKNHLDIVIISHE